MISIVLTVIGLALNMIGVLLLYFYGPPIFTILPDGSELVTYAENSEQVKQKTQIAKRNIKISKTALGTIFFGFLFQLAGMLL
jgi:hypothetical protein